MTVQRKKSSRGFSTVYIFVLLMIVLGYELFAHQLRGSIYQTTSRSSAGVLVTGPLTPHGKVILGVEVFYMLPSTPSISGVLVFFHGCSHGGQDFFILPEDRIVALSALNRGLAVVSPTSNNREHGCWTVNDVSLISEALAAFRKDIGLPAHLPLMGMGASSGGAFLFRVYKQIKLKSMVSYIMGLGFDESDITAAASSLPATAYVHMPRDEQTSHAVAESMAVLKAANVATMEWLVQPHPLTPELCDRRLPELGDRRCHAFLQMVKKKYKGLLKEDDNNVLKSYTNGDWKAAMQESELDIPIKKVSSHKNSHIKPGQLSSSTLHGHAWLWASMEEEIAVSYAMHEMTAEHREEVLDFLMIHAGLSVL